MTRDDINAVTESLPKHLRQIAVDTANACCEDAAWGAIYAQVAKAMLAAHAAPSELPLFRSQQFRDGYRRAVKDAASWLHGRARAMRDPKAVAILHSAATNFGWSRQEMKQIRHDLAQEPEETHL